MAGLTGKTIAATYHSILKVSTSDNQNLDTTLRDIVDGEDTASCLKLATDKVTVTLGTDSSDKFIISNGTSSVLEVSGNTDDVTLLDDLILDSDTCAIYFGDDQDDVILTHTNDVGLTLNSTNKLMFNDASQFVQGSSATVLSIGATDEIDLTATAIDINGTVDISGTLTVSADDTGADVRIYSATASEGLLYDASEDELGLLLTTKLKFHDIGGGEEIYASANGHLEINAGTTLDITAPTVDVNASTAVTIDTPSVTVTDTTTSSATEGGFLRLGSNDGAVMASGHRLGVLEFAGAEDTSNTMTVGAKIQALTDATWSDTENGAYLSFYTTDGDASQTEQVRIDASGNTSVLAGNLVITGATKGIIHTNSGTVTQGTSITTGVTLNTTSGVITMHATAIAADENIEFTVTNSTVQADSVILLTMQDENTVDNSQLYVGHHTITGGSFKITVRCAGGDDSSATAVKVHFLVINNS